MIYLLQCVIKQYRMNQQNLQLFFIDLKKAYDSVTREILWKVIKKKEIKIAYIYVIQDMYEPVSTSVRTQDVETNDFPLQYVCIKDQL